MSKSNKNKTDKFLSSARKGIKVKKGNIETRILKEESYRYGVRIKGV